MKTLDNLVLVALNINIYLCQQRAEKERERKCTGLITDTSFTPALIPSTSFVSSAADPTMMDLDVTHNHDEFLQQMKGKCFDMNLQSTLMFQSSVVY